MTAESGVQSYSKNLDRPRQARKILRGIVEGLSNVAIAEQLGCDQSAIWYWRQRHADTIEAALDRAAAEVQDFAIASKVQRIADYDEMRAALREEASKGAVWTEETRHGQKKHLNAALQEWRAVNKQAAEELDQLPRAGVTVNNQNVVIVKTVATGSGKPHPELDREI